MLTNKSMLALCAILSFALVGSALAQPAADEAPGRTGAFATSTVYPGVSEYRWTFHVPVLTIEHKEFAATAPSQVVRPLHWDFEGPTMRTERREIGKVPEFSCKYGDLMLPNECKTVWRRVFADLPMLVQREQHFEIEMPEWRWQTTWFPLDVPRWRWSDKDFRLSVPAIATDKP